MNEPTEPFAELTRRGHQLFAAAVQAWEQAAASLAEAGLRPGGPPEVRASLEAAFEFAAQMLADQREFAKKLMSMSTGVLTSTAQRVLPDLVSPASTGSPAPSAVPSGQTPQAPAARTDTAAAAAGTTTVPTKAAPTKAPATKAPAKKAPAKKAPAKKAQAKTTAATTTAATPATKTAPAQETAAKKTAAKKTVAQKAASTPAKKAAPAGPTPGPGSDES